MKIIRKICIGFIVFILVLAGYIYFQYGDVLGINIIPPTPEKYVKQAILFMDKQGIYNDDENWITVKHEVLEKARDCQSYEETYPYLEKALKQVGGKHSRFIPSSEMDSTLVANMPDVDYLQEGILYIHLPSFSGDENECEEYVSRVIEEVRKYTDMKGVIIDLQHNTGGDMGPMVAAISCFLPDGEVLAFENHGICQSVLLENGVVSGGGSRMVVQNPYKVTGVKVAILQDELTASSGEATLLTFRGLDYAMTFGHDSAGYCSCNNTKYMYDGSLILLTTGHDVARTNEYFCEDPISPSVLSDNPKQDAIEWILR